MDGLLGMKIKHHLFYREGRVEEEKNGDNNELLICFGGSSQVGPQTHSCYMYFLYNKNAQRERIQIPSDRILFLFVHSNNSLDPVLYHAFPADKAPFKGPEPRLIPCFWNERYTRTLISVYGVAFPGSGTL